MSEVADHMAIAEKLLGDNETEHHAIIAAFIRQGSGITIDPRATPWCMGFVNGALGLAGEHGTGGLWARDALKIGTAVAPRDAHRGDVIVFPRGNGAGHVGFISKIDITSGRVWVLGGNQAGGRMQGGGVCVEVFALSKALGIRRISKAVVVAALDNPNMIA